MFLLLLFLLWLLHLFIFVVIVRFVNIFVCIAIVTFHFVAIKWWIIHSKIGIWVRPSFKQSWNQLICICPVHVDWVHLDFNKLRLRSCCFQQFQWRQLCLHWATVCCDSHLKHSFWPFACVRVCNITVTWRNSNFTSGLCDKEYQEKKKKYFHSYKISPVTNINVIKFLI